ncbi:hypothetical protein [Mobilicoccus caccae]|uniref:Uncharacterized protein n=1 Tax=Mobilicoccus caccae TaxID=1859295 RepID=A0ABQ6IQ88_9MICO|nr:hypothetical protein [Mobilicoccus caccae]GMA40070.1 hypothetical protein GCM10025883_21150 [Mobilicoccus caccae]
MSTFITFVAADPAGGNHLPMPAWAFGVLALAVFAVLLLFVWMFRHTAQAMIEGGRGHDARGHGHAQAHGAPGHGAHPTQGRHH